ncbi:hypothetical protein ABPG73_004959 [Tetrahymena malaccensis]
MDINFQNSIQFNDQEKIVESIQGENLQNFDKKDIQNKQNLIENQQQISQEKRYDYYQIPKKNQIDMFKDNENDQRYLITKIQSQESSKQRNKKVIQKSDSKIPEQNYSKKSCQFIEQGDLSSNSSDKNNDQDEIYINQEKLQLISQKGELINKGGQGFVYTVKNDQNQVLKISPYSYPDIQRQHQIIKKIQKGNKISYTNKQTKDISVNDQEYFQYFERCNQNLLQFLNDIQTFPEDQLFKILTELCQGLAFLRKKFIVHSDIKPQNILVTKNGNYIFTDFGCSQIKIIGKRFNPYKIHTPFYTPQEQKQKNAFVNFKSDVYSLGLTLKNVILQFGQKNNLQNNQIKIMGFLKSIQAYFQENVIQNDINQRHDIYQVIQFLYAELNKIDVQNYQNPIKNISLKIELLTKKKNPDYIKKALDIIQGLSNKNLKKLLKSLEAQEIFKNQTYRSLDFFLLEKSLNGLSDQDFFEFYIKIYEKKENQDKKQEASCEIKTIEELKYLMENHKYITINLSEKAQKENILTEMRNSLQNKQNIKNLVVYLKQI